MPRAMDQMLRRNEAKACRHGSKRNDGVAAVLVHPDASLQPSSDSADNRGAEDVMRLSVAFEWRHVIGGDSGRVTRKAVNTRLQRGAQGAADRVGRPGVSSRGLYR